MSVCALVGCRNQETTTADGIGLLPDSKLGDRIGTIANVPTPQPARVQGYGLVGGLAGTGSGDCPPAVREYLRRYIMGQLSTGARDVDKLIDSKNTAVVRLEAVVPPAWRPDEHFDVRVSLLTGSEAVSLHGGWLYKSELLPVGTVGGTTKAIATAEGPVFIDGIGGSKPNLREGYILGGGRPAILFQGLVVLRKADFLLASQIRNRLNQRYGTDTAQALSPSLIGFQIPSEYRRRRMWFVSMIAATYMEQTPELIEARVNSMVHRLATGDSKDNSEAALEALGRETLAKTSVLLQSPDEEIRLRAARCMLNLRDDRGFGILREIALDPKSQRRLEALDALVVGAARNDAAALAQQMLRDSDPAVVIGAYERLRELQDPSVVPIPVGRGFQIEQVFGSNQKAIYVARSGDPRIVLFGAPLTCGRNVFVESSDGAVMVNAKPGQDFVSIVRKRPTRPGVIGPLTSTFDVADIIGTLGGESGQARDGGRVGLEVPYSDVAVLMEQLVAKQAVAAQFWPGPLPKLGLIIKK